MDRQNKEDVRRRRVIEMESLVNKPKGCQQPSAKPGITSSKKDAALDDCNFRKVILPSVDFFHRICKLAHIPWGMATTKICICVPAFNQCHEESEE